MTNTDFPHAAPSPVDTGPLSWVMVEIREALGRSRTALFEAGGRTPEDQATQLQHAKSHLHQAHGALQMVDIEGVVAITQLAEDALDRFKDGSVKCSTDNVQVVAQLYQALLEYLQGLLDGAPSQPVRLFPYYRAVKEMLAAERVHPADLFYPDLSRVPALPLAPGADAPDAAPDYLAYRQRFERALLPYLKSTETAAQQQHAAALLEAIMLVADAQQDGKARTFWLAMQAFAQLVASGRLAGGLYVKQLFGLINLQIRRLSQGNAAQPEAMLRDALFFLAADAGDAGHGNANADGAGAAPELVRQLRRQFALDGLVPADYEKKRYGQIDAEALERAKASMAQAKASWDRLANAEIDPDLDAAFSTALSDVAAECDKLDLPALSGLLRQLAHVANAAITRGRSEELALEMATALLFAEHGLQQIRHLPDDFAAHADTIGARLLALVSGRTPPEPAQWQGSLTRQMQQDDTVVALAMEMKTGLRQVEKVLDEYYGDPSKRPSLKDLDPVLYQLQGALAILDQDDAMRAVQHVKAAVQALASGQGDPAQEPKALDDIAQNVGALGFFVDMLAQNAAGARERFAFDAEHGTFRSVPFRKMAATESIPMLDEQVPAPVPMPVPPANPVPPVGSDEAVEAELLEIFIAEAQEVLVFVNETLARPRAEAGSQDNLTMLRRSFHTLKGSGRMVGLMKFADGAHSIERVMNVWLAEERVATDALFALLERAAGELGAWVQELVATGHSSRNAEALIDAAARVQEGGAFEMDAAGPAQADGARAATPASSEEQGGDAQGAAAATAAAAVIEAPAASGTDFDLDAFAADALAAPSSEADAAAATDAVPVASEAAPAESDAAVAESEAEAEAEAAVAQSEAAVAESDAAPADAIASADAEPNEPHESLEAFAALDGFDAPEEIEALSLDEPLSLLDTPEPSVPAEPPELSEPLETSISIDFGDAAPAPAAPKPAPATGNVIEFPTITAPLVARDDNLKQIGSLEIPLPLYNIYLAETDELVRLLTRDFGEWRHEPRRPVNQEALAAAHTLTGTSGTVGFHALRELAHSLELTLQSLQPPAPHLDQVQHDLLDFTIERIRQMLQSFAQGDMPPPQPELIAALHDLREQLAATPPGAGPEIEGRLDTLLAETMENIVAPPAPAETPMEAMFREAYESLSGSIPESELTVAAAPKKPQVHKADDDIDDLFNSAFDDAFDEPALTQIAAPQVPASEPEPALSLVASAADETDDVFDSAVAAPPEPDSAPAVAAEAPPAPAAEEAEPAPATEPEPEPEPQPLLATLDLPPELEAEVLPLPPIESPALAAAPAVFHDELDADLLPVFLEEGADLLPQVGQSLRAWQHTPSDTSHAQNLLRVLHTVKGSARMAGAMRLGQHAHEIETHIENMVHAGSATPQAFDELLAHYDHALLLFEQLQHPEALQQAAAAAASDAGTEAHDGAAAAASTEAVTSPGAAPPAPAAQTHGAAGIDEDAAAASKSPLVRVRADILDRLVNQAGEVSISRSKLENEVETLRASLFDFSENLTRLRRQLREVEMQAESQIASRMSISSEREFDPLEFDRFTRLQELTRMMAESVNDVASFHESLSRSVDSASDDLTLQARLTRDLQRDLMRVRMVPFASVSERLFRVARQSAKEVDKRVNLDIRGSAVEVDRSVLERMTAPFEHLLRNAIAHGIEARAARTGAGKAETGELLVQVAQQGNEVVIEFSDDGAGLDLERIRAKARAVGLLQEDEEVSDAQAADLIFEPGFSTADALTELSGRGVGMDVVQSEAQALGGRVDMYSERGKGTRFAIRLPLTLAVTQVVLIAAGGNTYALPSILVEQVLQMKEAPLAEARKLGSVPIQGQQAPLHYLPQLLGDADARPPMQRSCPVLMLKNGNDRVALQVDEVLGNREVVIKNIGPQLSRMAGIAGATVLGSGDIVLILNPVALAGHLAHHPELKPLPKAKPAEGAPQVLRPHDKTVMVVDDSMTVRRVTQRLLEREGFQVMLAKDGVDALEQLQAHRPDMMLVDIEMPRMDGFDLTRNVRGDERTRDIPIIMITSRSADKHRNYAMQLGVNAYFGKPYQDDVLLAAIAGLLTTA
jgi:chemosensory pili system protein ChpA (sensor histidine kinase/response regulator)